MRFLLLLLLLAINVQGGATLDADRNLNLDHEFLRKFWEGTLARRKCDKYAIVYDGSRFHPPYAVRCVNDPPNPFL